MQQDDRLGSFSCLHKDHEADGQGPILASSSKPKDSKSDRNSGVVGGFHDATGANGKLPDNMGQIHLNIP